MQCPNCSGQKLRPVLTKQGVEVDYCDTCKGVWLDRGELFHFVAKPKLVAQRLRDALKTKTPTNKRSPRSGKPMLELVYWGGVRLDYCPTSGGLWFDAGELKALVEHERNVSLALDAGLVNADKKTTTSKRKRRSGRLLPLPNLFLRSTLTLAGLYAILGAVLIAAVEFAGLDPNLALGVGVLVVVLQFLIGPYVMDLSLAWLYRMQWVEPTALPSHLRDFVAQVCRKHRMRVPRFGIIDDGAPQAFTYGHTPSNARIVISRGILELLDPAEVRAVVGHEMGHAVHWDMFLMTIAQLVPLLLFYLYQALVRITRSRNNKSGGAPIAVAVGAYLLYIVSEYVVLWFSRTREYHADRFSGQATGNPNALASALVKIAYGLAGRQKQRKDASRDNARSGDLAAIGALGIFNAGAARTLAITSYSNAASDGAHEVNREHLLGAMRWDLWNPWAKWYELNSTHPLVAHRLQYLADQAQHQGQEPYVVFNERKPESYWDEFAVDMLVNLLPVLAVIGTLALLVGPHPNWHAILTKGHDVLAAALIALGAALLVRYQFIYQGAYFPHMSIAALLKRVKVSDIRPVPCTVRGTVIGRGVPGYILSEDFVLMDDTGIIFLDYRQPLKIWEMLFALLRADRYQGKKVLVNGWYRRGPTPFIQVKSIQCEGETSTSWVPLLNRLTALAVLMAGFFWLMHTA